MDDTAALRGRELETVVRLLRMYRTDHPWCLGAHPARNASRWADTNDRRCQVCRQTDAVLRELGQ